MQGTRTLRGVSRSVGMRPRCVFVSPPGLGVLLERLQERGSETPEEIALRVQTAQVDRCTSPLFSACRLTDTHPNPNPNPTLTSPTLT